MFGKVRVSRRSLLRVGGAVGVSALLAACASQTVVAPTPAATSAAPAAAPATATAAPAAAAAPATATSAPAAAAAPAAATATPNAQPAAAASALQESPVLAALVKAGTLPALKDRLPDEPMVVNRKGKYGGTLRMASNATDLFPWELKYAGAIQATPMRLSADLKSIIPNLFKAVEISSDFKTVTCHMRKGVRWSDGQPYTVADWQFWYDDVLSNKDLTPVPLQWFIVGGELMKFTKLDDYSFRLDFAGPNPSFPTINLAHVYGFWDDSALPAHYLKQFHLKYNDKATDQAKAAKFEFWYQWFASKQNPNQNADVPRLGAYIVDKQTPQAVTYKRNPFYWMVDSEGKQLPYLDAISMDRVDDMTVIEAKAVAGNYDYVPAWQLLVKNFKTYKDGEQKGGYKVATWKSGLGAEVLYNFNMNFPDAVWNKVFSDARFRQAMSVAIDRKEINDTLYFGFATPAQLTAHKTSRAYKVEYATAFAQFDLAMANKLLDDMGLKWDGAKKSRLLSDGRPMQIAFDANGTNPVHDLVFEHWKRVGIQVDYKPITRTLLRPKITSNSEMMSSWGGDEVMDTLLFRRPKWFAPIVGDESTWAPEWAQWYATVGKSGKEPTAEIKQLFTWLDKYLETNDVQYVDKALASQAKNIWTIGTVADAPAPMIFNKDLKNVPADEYWVWDNLNGNESYPEAWYFDR